MTVTKEFALPDLGEGLTESEIVAWKVAVGDAVELNQIIAEVETAKAIVELPSPYRGVIARLYAEAGSTVDVGAPLLAFTVEGEAAPDAGTPDAADDDDDKPEPNLVGYGAMAEGSGRPARRARRAAANGEQQAAPAPTPTPTPAAASAPAAVRETAAPAPAVEAVVVERPRSTPPVRQLARSLGVDLECVTGTGERGLITRDDVQQAASGAEVEGSAHAAAPSSSPVERETRSPIKGVRKYTAQAMVQSAFSAPHVTEFLTVDVTPTMELLDELRATREFSGVKLTPLTIVAKAVGIAVSRNPSVNTKWDESAQEIVQFNYLNLGIAAATPRGLTVPNIKDAGQLSLRELGQALAELATTAREGKTSPAALAGGTLSITNIGVFGIDAGTPILNPGEAAILAVGAVRRQPWEYRGEIALRQIVTLSLSFDHRLVDGEQGSRFLADIGTLLAHPARALAMV